MPSRAFVWHLDVLVLCRASSSAKSWLPFSDKPVGARLNCTRIRTLQVKVTITELISGSKRAGSLHTFTPSPPQASSLIDTNGRSNQTGVAHFGCKRRFGRSRVEFFAVLDLDNNRSMLLYIHI